MKELAGLFYSLARTDDGAVSDKADIEIADSDVIAGLAIGAAVERLLRRWTGFGLSCRE
jgi:hypothetical protein